MVVLDTLHAACPKCAWSRGRLARIQQDSTQMLHARNDRPLSNWDVRLRVCASPAGLRSTAGTAARRPQRSGGTFRASRAHEPVFAGHGSYPEGSPSWCRATSNAAAAPSRAHHQFGARP